MEVKEDEQNAHGGRTKSAIRTQAPAPEALLTPHFFP